MPTSGAAHSLGRDITEDMSAETVLAFAAMSAVLVAIPGPAVILVLKNAMLRGRGSAIVTALGVLVADLIWATASVIGLIALLVSSQLALDVVRVAGAAYLFYLGVRLLRTREFDMSTVDGEAGRLSHVTPGRAFGEGFLCDLSNPKTVLVYASVIPQFLTSSSSGSDAFVLGVVFAALGFASSVVYALVFGAAERCSARGASCGTYFAAAEASSCSSASVYWWSARPTESRAPPRRTP
jgi:threonine/homoserine/homoserine lactone efflux protein